MKYRTESSLRHITIKLLRPNGKDKIFKHRENRHKCCVYCRKTLKKSLALQKTMGVRRKWRYKMVRRGENKMAED